MASSEFVDPYLDPETGLLKNKIGAQTKAALDEAEGDLKAERKIDLSWQVDDDRPRPYNG